MKGATPATMSHPRPARAPVAHIVEGGRVEQRDARRDAAQQRTDRDADESESHGRRGRATKGSERIDDQRGGRGTREREPHVSRDRRDSDERDADRHGERGARVDAEDPGIRERIARERLDEPARQSQRRARHDPEHGSREARLHDDVGVALVGRAEQRVDHGPELDLLRSEQQAEGEAGRERDRQDEDPDRAPCGGARDSRRTPVRLTGGGGVAVRHPSTSAGMSPDAPATQ
jgi:hypothetical protein